MNIHTRFSLALVAVVSVACNSAPGADVAGFPRAQANAYCHFAYKCCPPADRTVFPKLGTGNLGNASFSQLATQYGYKDESECSARLGDVLENLSEPLQASVKDGRITYTLTGAQACLDALTAAATSCSAAGFAAAFTPDPNTLGAKAVCDASTWTAGAVANNGTCTLAKDCSSPGSVCAPPQPDAGTGPVVEAGGICQDPPIHGQACTNNPGCAPNDSCCYQNTCQQFIARGQTCTRGFFGSCSAQPCNPSADFCGYTAAAYSCQALIASGQACGKDQFGNDLSSSCISRNCSNGVCQPNALPTTYKVCSGNPDKI